MEASQWFLTPIAENAHVTDIRLSSLSQRGRSRCSIVLRLVWLPSFAQNDESELHMLTFRLFWKHKSWCWIAKPAEDLKQTRVHFLTAPYQFWDIHVWYSNEFWLNTMQTLSVKASSGHINRLSNEENPARRGKCTTSGNGNLCLIIKMLPAGTLRTTFRGGKAKLWGKEHNGRMADISIAKQEKHQRTINGVWEGTFLTS